MKVHLVNFATEEFYHSQRKLNTSALRHGVDNTISYRWIDIQKTSFYEDNKEILVQKRGAGYWLWKPYIILDHMESINDGDIVIYADSGIEVIGNLKPLIELCLKKKDAVIFHAGGEYLNKHYTKRDCFIMMDCDSEEYWCSLQCLASFHVYIKNDACIEFLNQWLSFCKNKNILTDNENICGKNNLDGFIDHRHDQSVLSLLAQKTGKEIFRDPTQYGNHLKKEEERIKGEYYLKSYFDITPYINSSYGTILNHHRKKRAPLNKRIKSRLINIFVKYIHGIDNGAVKEVI